MNINKLVRERNEAIFSLDEKKIRDYARKYQMQLPTTEIVFWGGVYKAILNLPDAPEEKRLIARKWLAEHGMSEAVS